LKFMVAIHNITVLYVICNGTRIQPVPRLK
jgi:hypothetical protein